MSSTHIFFCCEVDCGAEAPVYGGRCYLCSCAKKWREAGYALANKHTCSGEFDYERGCYVCDDHDDPLCPSNNSESQAKHCADCGVQRQETEPVLQCDWYCPPCWKVRFAPKKCCTDCGSVPKDGFFPCYRGEDPLCADCEEAAYGPPSPVDWRERTGRCSKCDFFYELHCSSDSRDLCYKCQ